MSIDFDAIKQGQRAMWSAGDYPDLAQTIEGAAEALLERVDPRAGEELLDVATGSGNVAIPAARSGARVTGLDLTPELLQAARRRAAQAGVDVRWIEGDAEQLPFAEGSFDRVTSCFGVIFAPRHERAAAQLARVARPGGTIGFTGWTPEGLLGKTFTTIASYMPAPPPELQPPIMWGTEEHVHALFADTGAELSCERRTVTFAHESPTSWADYNERVLGPLIMAKAGLEPQGRWEELRGELIALYERANEAGDGTFRARAEYLLTLARMPA